ncbi:hypothetical protein [Pontimicrobium sp. SW4]|uniref:Adhesin domain-containing protein n=1 Tax=Pontimicrobium sp. SW4 TaxID=3153519 RepID=A0AAU7BVB9_9FLAO
MKKYISLLTFTLFLLTQTTSKAQEGTNIPFNKGTLKICSSKNFIIKGYDGNEVIIKSLHSTKNEYHKLSSLTYTSSNPKVSNIASTSSNLKISKANTIYPSNIKVTKAQSLDSIYVSYFPSIIDLERSKGLKKLGKKAAAQESGIYLLIEQKGDELYIKDDANNLLMTKEKYEITIPNSVDLNWNASECDKNSLLFYGSNPSEIKNFMGEIEISSALSDLNLLDVSGPVSITTLGGNVNIKFDKITPSNLYSIYSNNGFIDITLPKSANILVDATAAEILSDLDFNILSEENKNPNQQQMNLKLGTGKVKMKLNADLGNIYLRKQ